MTQNNDTKRFFKKRNPENPYKQRIFEIYCWCERRDLNPYESPHTPLKRARLPIPPLSRLPVYYTTDCLTCQALFLFFSTFQTVFLLPDLSFERTSQGRFPFPCKTKPCLTFAVSLCIINMEKVKGVITYVYRRKRQDLACHRQRTRLS